MDAQEIRPLTYAGEEDGEDLAAAGVRLPAARVLVFPARTKGATAAEIIRGTGRVSPAVNGALRRLVGQGWISGQGNGTGDPDDEGLAVFAGMAVRCDRGIGPRGDR